MKRARRIFWLGLLLLVGGAVVATLIAEGIGLSGRVRFGAGVPLRFVAAYSMFAEVRDVRGNGWRYLDWVLLSKSEASAAQYRFENHLDTFEGDGDVGEVHPDATDTVPYWSDLRRGGDTAGPARIAAYRHGSASNELGIGWPAIAFRMDWNPTQRGEPRGGTRLSQSIYGTERVLIWRLIPLGFALDTLLYAACLALLAGGIRVMVRARRRGRGACVTCGYDLRGLAAGVAVCPECGAGPKSSGLARGGL